MNLLQKLISGLLLTFLLAGCVTTAPVSSQPQAAANQGQKLPITATAKMGQEVIELEVAKTPEQQEIGLMFRTDLAKNRGMNLSLFSAPCDSLLDEKYLDPARYGFFAWRRDPINFSLGSSL